MSYESQLLAYGIPPEQAARDARANEMQWFRNRDLPSYGRAYAEDQESDHDRD